METKTAVRNQVLIVEDLLIRRRTISVQQPFVQLVACNVNSANVTAPITPELEIDWDGFSGDDDPSQTLWSNWSIPPIPTDPVLFSVSMSAFAFLGL